MEKNQSGKCILAHSLLAAGGLILFGVGVYFTLQANLGVGPWDILNLGLSDTLGIRYGTACIGVSLLVLLVDVLMKEKIGIGTVLDAVIVGKTVDLCNCLGFVPAANALWLSLVWLLIGFFLMGFSQYLYMKAGLGCGPRDTMLVALSRRFRKCPIGIISLCILGVVTVLGLCLGGPVGLGTVLCAGFEGPIMELEFRLLKFDAAEVKHQNLMESAKVLFKK